MEKSKFIGLIKSFSLGELKQFEDFVASPFFNQKTVLVSMTRFLIELAPDFSGASIQKKNVYQALFPDRIYDDKHMRYLMSYLSKLAERFLMITRYEKQIEQSQLDLMQCFLERKLEKHYIQQRGKVKQLLEGEKIESSTFFYHKLIFSELGEQNFMRQRIRQFDANIQFASDYLDRFYFLKKLRYTCGMLDRQSIFQGEYQPNFSKELILHLKKQQFFGQDILRLYHTILQALLEEDQGTHFQELKALINQSTNHIDPYDLRNIYSFGINYCARMIRAGKEIYVEEALQLYLDGIRKDILLQDGYLSPWAFTNVVKLALRLKHYQWIEDFIWEYAPKLPEAFRENALHYNLAELYYYTKAYDDALAQLTQVHFSDLNYHLGSRVILAKIYYETEEENALLSLLAAFTVFLKRNKKISNDLKKTYLNFCHYLYQIVRKKKKYLPKLREEINGAKFLTDRNWLLEALKLAENN